MSFARYSESLSKMRNFYTYLIFDFRFWGQITPKVKIFENVFPDSAMRHRTLFRDQIWWNRPLQSCRKVLGITTHKKLGLRGTRLSPNFTQNEPIAPKIPWTLSPVDMSTYTEFCPELRIGCALPDLFRKDWFFGPKSNYNINFQPTINKTRSALGRAHVPPTKVFRRLEVKWQLPFVSKRGSN